MIDNELMTRAKKLYWDINAKYGSPHADSKEEINDAFPRLYRALNNGYTPEQIMRKVDELNDASSGEMKTKTSKLIYSRFWEKEYIKPIPYRQYPKED